MKSTEKTSLLTTSAVRYYLFFACLYVILIFTVPPNIRALHAYNMSALEYRLILFALALPSLAVWLAAFIGYTKIHQYARAIRYSAEGPAFERLATGCAWLAWSLPLMTIIPLSLNSLANVWSDFHPSAIIIINYASLILALVAFGFIANASRQLLASKNRQDISALDARFIIFTFLAIGVAYCFFTFRRFDLSSITAANNPYFLPIWLMVITVIIPFLYAWFVGLLGAYEIMLYSRQERGVLYRKALAYVSGGLLAIILSSIALQYINSVIPRVGYLVIDYRLVLTLLFRLIGGAGFILLALGAIRLKKIEDV